MKFGCIFLFFAVFLIYFQASDAVKCQINFAKKAECSSCVFFTCIKDGLMIISNGCPEDFFKECSNYTEAVEFIKSKNYNDLEYKIHPMVKYISGCGNETVGDECILEKVFARNDKTVRYTDNYCFEAGKPCINPADLTTSAPIVNPAASDNSVTSKLIGMFGIGWMIFAWIF